MVGCSTAPVELISQAETAYLLADSVGAGRYAPAEFQAARDTLEAAKGEAMVQGGNFFLSRDYERAESLFTISGRLLRESASIAGVRIDSLRTAASALLLRAQVVSDSVLVCLEAIPAGKDRKAEIELLKQDLLAYQSQIPEVEVDINRMEYELAIGRAQLIIKKMEELCR